MKGATSRAASSQVSLFFIFVCRFCPFTDPIQNPPERIIEHGGFERISDELTFFAGRDELGVFEQIEVIRNARRSHLERLADLADGEIVFLEHLKDAPAGGVAKSFEEEVQ